MTSINEILEQKVIEELSSGSTRYGKWQLTPTIISPAQDGDGNELEGLFLFKRGIMVHLPKENRWIKLKTVFCEKGVMMEVPEEVEGATKISTFDPETLEPQPRWFVPLEKKEEIIEILIGGFDGVVK